MPSYSLSGLRKDACNGHSVIALSVDGKQVFCFIGWMQHTCEGMPRLNDLCLNFARGFCGLPVDRRQKFHEHSALVPATVLMIQRNIVRKMMPMQLSSEAKACAIDLQGYATHHAFKARVHVGNALRNPSLYCAEDDCRAAIREQVWAARNFMAVAGVRGLFDTPSMDDAHAVEVECSRIEPVSDRDARTLTVMAYFAGLPAEFGMLKGLLCMQHPFNSRSAAFRMARELFNPMMIAERMDSIRGVSS